MDWAMPPSCPEVEVSSQGDVRRRLPTVNGRWKRGSGCVAVGTVYKPSLKSINGMVYAVVRVARNGRRIGFGVHRLVCEAFHGPAPSKAHGALHANGDSLCNVRSNLYWGTQQQNIDDRERHGNTMRGDRHYAAKLSAADVPRIRERLAAGEPATKIAERYSVSAYAIYDIKRGKSWKRV